MNFWLRTERKIFFRFFLFCFVGNLVWFTLKIFFSLLFFVFVWTRKFVYTEWQPDQTEKLNWFGNSCRKGEGSFEGYLTTTTSFIDFIKCLIGTFAIKKTRKKVLNRNYKKNIEEIMFLALKTWKDEKISIKILIKWKQFFNFRPFEVLKQSRDTFLHESN